MIFTKEDAQGIHHPHCDELVLVLPVAGKLVTQVLIDTGSSADILVCSAFDRMRIQGVSLRLCHTLLHGFMGGALPSPGAVTLPVTFEEEPIHVTRMVDFLVVDYLSSYNMILGGSTLYALWAVLSVYHLSMKYPTRNGVAIVKVDQIESQEAYATSTKYAREAPVACVDIGDTQIA